MSNTDFEDAPDGAEEVEVDAEGPDEGLESEVEDNPDEVETAEEDGGEGDAEEVDDEPEQRRPSRAQTRIQTLRREAEEARDRASRFERELQEARAEQQRRATQMTPEQEAEKLLLMTPEERSDYKLNKALAEMRREQQMAAFRAEDMADQTAFQAKAQSDPLYRKYADRVEQQRQEFLKQGQAIPREQLFYWMVGKEAVAARTSKGAQRQKRQAQDNVRRQTVAPGNGKADVRGERRQSTNTPAKRLEGVII